MIAIRGTIQLGPAAKVRDLLVHLSRHDGRGPSRPLDWDKELVGTLLGEFVGMSDEERKRV